MDDEPWPFTLPEVSKKALALQNWQTVTQRLIIAWQADTRKALNLHFNACDNPESWRNVLERLTNRYVNKF